MLMDAENTFSWNQDLAQATGDHNSTNVIDLGAAETIPGLGGTALYDVGRGALVRVFCRVTEAFTSAGSATLTVKLVESAAAALTSPTTLLATAAIPVADLKQGYEFKLPAIPPGVTKRYLGIIYTIGTAAMTAGEVSAGLVLDIQQNPTVTA